MNRIMEKYNYAFGYVKGYFTLCGLVGIGAIIAGFYLMLQGEPMEAVLGIIGSGVIVVLIAAIIVITTRKKCPEDKKGFVSLTLSMMLVGLAAAFVLAWWFAKWMFKFIFSLIGINIGNSSAKEQIASTYYMRGSKEPYSFLHKSASGNGIVLADSSNNQVECFPHGKDGVLSDAAGNIYYPAS